MSSAIFTCFLEKNILDDDADDNRVVKRLLNKNVEIIALKHCFFLQNDDSLANYCTEALLGGKEGEHSITLRV